MPDLPPVSHQALSADNRAGDTRAVQRTTFVGLVVNLLLAAAKFMAGILASSQALIADAAHSLSDSTTDIAVIVGAPYWSAPADTDHPYGHGRIETVITFLIGGVLAAVGIGLAYKALGSMIVPAENPPGWAAFAVACLSMVAKEWLFRWTLRVGRRVRSAAMVANAWHHRTDGMSSLPVAIAVLGIHIRPEWTFLDPVAAVIVSVFVFQAAWKIGWPAVRQLIDAGAAREDREEILRLALAVEGVEQVHGLRTRHAGPGLHVDIHVLVDPDLSVRHGHEIAGSVKSHLLRDGPDVFDVLVHIEPHETNA